MNAELIEALERLKFFNQRAERELWVDKPREIQDKDIESAEKTIELAISALSADVRPNIHGHWEEDGHGHIICSACKEAKLNTHRSKFCDSCGAIMDGKRQCERCIYHEENGCIRWVCIDAEPKGEKGTGCTSTHNVLKR